MVEDGRPHHGGRGASAASVTRPLHKDIGPLTIERMFDYTR
ncbi:hypothetical protein NOCARDAX2BIS_480081 [Nocardioides sp. AX2bis]|nr:hypothetical protein NOCARDAX2BIS_480081 [Nocardioides sp. AX2bis]